MERIRKAEAITGPPPVHARVRVVGKTHVSDTSELESESEYSQAPTDISDYYHDKLQVTLHNSDYIKFPILGKSNYYSKFPKCNVFLFQLHTSDQVGFTLEADQYTSQQQQQQQQYRQGPLRPSQQQLSQYGRQHQQLQQQHHQQLQQQHHQQQLNDEYIQRHLMTTEEVEEHVTTSSTTRNVLNVETQDLVSQI